MLASAYAVLRVQPLHFEEKAHAAGRHILRLQACKLVDKCRKLVHCIMIGSRLAVLAFAGNVDEDTDVAGLFLDEVAEGKWRDFQSDVRVGQ